MKKVLITIVLISFLFPQEKVNINNLIKYGDKMFKVDDDQPFSGIA